MSTLYMSDPEGLERKKPSFCARFLKYTWKTISCLFSHTTLVSMVVSYCLLGAVTFENLEKENEKMVKRNISTIRNLAIDQLWNITYNDTQVLKEERFIENATDVLKKFEHNLWYAITKHGWDGKESTDDVQWNFAGALFYSIIVITTIGYGHIAPRTPWGKVVTIFYAILGIPLMLLCLSNIGDIMATSFRFLYWKVCCYVCTKQHNRRSKRTRSTRGTIRMSTNRSIRARTESFRKSARTSTRSADSGYEVSELGPSSHSDTELRYHDEMPKLKAPSQPRSSQRSRLSDANIPAAKPTPKQNFRGGSLDRRRMGKNLDVTMDPVALAKTPVLCNRYVVEQTEMALVNHVTPNRFERASDRPAANPPSPSIPGRRAISMPRTHYLEPPRAPSPVYTYKDDMESVRSSRKKKRQYQPSPTIMSPLGYGHRSKYLDEPESDDDYIYDDYFDSGRPNIKPVPIWLCVFLVISYIIAGMFLFHAWEKWSYLDSAYFCFITLTTIGFGDLFPTARVSDRDTYQQNIAFCSLYLLFGIALLAMSFNLVQEEVIANVKKVAKTLGIIKQERDEDDDD